MKSVVTYIRSLLGWSDDIQVDRLSFKREREDEGFSSEDGTPALKKPKQLMKTRFPTTMATNGNDGWRTEEKKSNVRYVPIQLESGYPSTSTPRALQEVSQLGARVRSVPVQLMGMKDKGSTTPSRKPRAPIMHTLIDEDDDHEVRLVPAKPEKIKKPIVYVNLDDYEDYPNPSEDAEVVFVKKVTAPPAMKPYKYFISDESKDVTDAEEPEEPIYLKLPRRASDKNSMSPRSYSKFIGPPGITKSYKKAPIPVSKWMQPKSSTLSRNRYLGLNGNTRATLNEVFNLDEKKNYQELIKKVAGSMKPASFRKPLEIFNLAEELASFRNTQKTQKKSLNEINMIQRDILSERENSSSTEYDPITVASLNSSDSEVEVIPSDISSSSSTKIDPINTLRDSYRDKAITSGDWLSKLDTKYRKKNLETQEKVKDARRESDIITKVNSEQRIAQLEHKLKYELSIPESLFEEPQPTVELPPLTPEQEKLVNRALGPGPPGQLLVEKFNLRIHRRDLQTLSGLNWLNDEVINFYMNLLMQRSEERKDLPKVYAANTFFYPKLMQSGQSGLRRWTRKVDIFAHELMVIPVHLGVHWCVCLIDFRAKKISYLDSMGGRNQPCLDALRKYLRDEHLDKKGKPFDEAGWSYECLKDIPQQMNGSDCGMFSCTFAEFSARDAPYTFTQAHMPYLRRKAALEILTGKLLL